MNALDSNVKSLNVIINHAYPISFDSIISQKITLSGLKILVKELIGFSLVHREFKHQAIPCLNLARDIYRIIFKKYTKYISDNERTCVNTPLLDLLSTGSSKYGMIHSFENYMPSMEQGIKLTMKQEIRLIVQLMPESLECPMGTLRGRVSVPPLAMACVNVNIPPEIIQLLLELGANPHQEYRLLSGENKRTVLTDFDHVLPVEKWGAYSERIKKVKVLLMTGTRNTSITSSSSQ